MEAFGTRMALRITWYNEGMMERKTKRNDILLIMGLLVMALLFSMGLALYRQINTRHPVAVVRIGEIEYGRFPLDVEITETIELSNGAYNILKIENGKADITEASCPDGICVRHWAISKQNETIVCLPNQVVVEIENGEESDVDSMTN